MTGGLFLTEVVVELGGASDVRPFSGFLPDDDAVLFDAAVGLALREPGELGDSALRIPDPAALLLGVRQPEEDACSSRLKTFPELQFAIQTWAALSCLHSK